MAKGIHPNKEIRKAIRQLEQAGWTVELARGRSAHRWGTAFCPARTPSCSVVIWGSPRVPEDLASRLRRSRVECECRPADGDRRA